MSTSRPDANPGADSVAAEVPAANRRNVLQSALSAIENLQGRLAAAEQARHEPIAIVGLAIRAPGGVTDADSYWKLLSDGLDVVSEVPADRWDVDAYYDPDENKLGKSRTKAGGFLDQIDGFEPSFFGMSPREAAGVDPQQRLLLETSWEALEDAGIAPDSLDGSRTGVFVGITSMDYSQRIDVNDPARSDIYLATGTALNAAAGRVSFTLGLRGPCMAIDTACSSSLVAIHTACQSLRNGESELVLAGGVNVILAPEPFVLISKWGMLSPDGRCKTFDADANGFVRGEGCGLLVLERLSDAVAKRRRILAVIRGSAVNQDGRSSGLTVPNGLAQQEVIEQALAAARLAPADVGYVEAHGTGTSLGDPIEVEALVAVYGRGRSPDRPLELGSVKSNIGHLEAASGVMSVIKLALALQHRQLPASLHVKRPTPSIPWDRIPARVSTRLHDWEPQNGRRIAGVSAFGFSGMNAHLLVEEAPPAPSATQESVGADRFVLPLSARSGSALQTLADRYADRLEGATDGDVRDACITAATGRAQLTHRLAVIGRDRPELLRRLRQVADGESAESVVRGQHAPGTRMRVAFLFTGQGSQYTGMGRELYDREPVFRAAFDRCAAVLDETLGRPLRDIVFTEGSGLEQTGFTQPALYALEVSLATLWQHWGIRPHALTGHSVGEFAAAAVAGVFSIETGARLIAERARLMQALPAGGAMSSIQGDAGAVERSVAAYASTVSIAARNAPGSLVIAGEGVAVAAISTALAATGARVQPLVVSHAFHSPLMAAVGPLFQAFAAQFEYAEPSIPWFSNLTGRMLDWSEWGHRMPEYWARHVTEPVDFEKGFGALLAAGCEACIEIGPHPVLCGMARLQVESKETPRAIEWLPSLRRGQSATDVAADSAAKLWTVGGSLSWTAFAGVTGRSAVALPLYPFQRQPYLIHYPKGPVRMHGPRVHELLGSRLAIAGVVQFERVVTVEDPAWVADHRIGGAVLMPMTAYLEIALAAARETGGEGALAIDNVEVAEPMVLREGAERLMQVSVSALEAPDTGRRIRIFSRPADDDKEAWTLHATALAGTRDAADQAAPLAEWSTGADREGGDAVDPSAFYDRVDAIGISFGPAFRALQTARCDATRGLASGLVGRTAAVAADAGKYGLHPALLDSCFHVAATAIGSVSQAGDDSLYLPVGVDRYALQAWPCRDDGQPLRSIAKLRTPGTPGESIVADVAIETADGRPVAALSGVRCRRVPVRDLRRHFESRLDGWFQAPKWREQRLAAPKEDLALADLWLLFDDGAGVANPLAARIRQLGGRTLLVAPGIAFATPSPDRVMIDPRRSDDYGRLMRMAAEQGPVRGVLSFWPLRIPAIDGRRMPGAIQAFGTESALLLIQAAAAHGGAGAPSRIWFVTSGSQAVDGSETLRIEQAPVAGLVRVAATEQPELRVTQIDLDPQGAAFEPQMLALELASDDDGERQIAYRKGARMVCRLQPHALSDAIDIDHAPERLNIAERGTLENLEIEPERRTPPGPGQVEIRVRASGLNFRDVLSALGMYPGVIAKLGSDCAGEIVAVGEGVNGFSIGDRVVAMVEGAFASHALARWEFVAPLPASLDFEQGAAIPTAYLTADITLNQIAAIKAGDRVLIHSGAGGVGMAAIALARQVGAEIFATAGSPEKRAAVAALGARHVLDSRSPAFADEIHRITGGEGVHVVLNSLAGAMMDRSFEVLADGGIFLEIGKRGLWTQERVDTLGRGIRYHVVDCNDNARETPEIVGAIFTRVLRELEAGDLPVLPCTTFAFERAPDAFRFMAQARHIGRVVLRHRTTPRAGQLSVGLESTCVVTGGLRGLGLRTAQWLAEEGAGALVLAGRSAPDENTEAILEALRVGGTRVVTVAADVATEEGVSRLVDALRDPDNGLPPLGGVFHAAGVLDDGPLGRLDAARLAAVMGPKADGAWRLLDRLSGSGLVPRFVVLFSSLSAIFGAAGQANYVAANAFLDALAQSKSMSGLPVLSVNWGAWSDIGMAARGTTVTRANAQGLLPISPSDGIQALSLLLRQMPAQAAVCPIDWPQLLRQLDPASAPRILDDALRRERDREGTASRVRADAPAIDFAALDDDVRPGKLVEMVRREVATVLGIGESADSILDDQAFNSLGLDSLTAVELRNRLQRAVARGLPATIAFDQPTVNDMARHLDGLFEPRTAEAAELSGEREVTTL